MNVFIAFVLTFSINVICFSQKSEIDLKLKSFDVIEHFEVALNQGKTDTTYYFMLTYISGYKYPNIKEGFNMFNEYFNSKEELLEYFNGLKTILEKGQEGTHEFITKKNKQYILTVKNGKLFWDYSNSIANGYKSVSLNKINSDIEEIELFVPKL